MLILRADACHSICKICILFFFFFPQKKKLTNTKSLEWLQIQYVSLCVATLFILSLNRRTFFLISIGCRLIVQQTKMMLVLQFIHVKSKGHSHDH